MIDFKEILDEERERFLKEIEAYKKITPYHIRGIIVPEWFDIAFSDVIDNLLKSLLEASEKEMINDDLKKDIRIKERHLSSNAFLPDVEQLIMIEDEDESVFMCEDDLTINNEGDIQ